MKDLSIDVENFNTAKRNGNYKQAFDMLDHLSNVIMDEMDEVIELEKKARENVSHVSLVSAARTQKSRET